MMRCIFTLPDTGAILHPARIRRLTLATGAVTAIFFVPETARVHATAIGPLDAPRVHETGEILEPSANKPPTRILSDEENPDEPAALRSVPEPSFEIYESLDRDINQTNTGDSHSSENFFGVEGFTSLSYSLTALEWIRQMYEGGYWLENDQWSDFRAIALASYLPEIRYWLGRDRWARFGALAIGGESNGTFRGDARVLKFSGDARAPKNGNVNATFTAPPSFGGATASPPAGGEKHKGRNKAAEKITSYELLLSLVKKVSKQPLFYLAMLGGAIVLLLAFRRQSAA